MERHVSSRKNLHERTGGEAVCGLTGNDAIQSSLSFRPLVSDAKQDTISTIKPRSSLIDLTGDDVSHIESHRQKFRKRHDGGRLSSDRDIKPPDHGLQDGTLIPVVNNQPTKRGRGRPRKNPLLAEMRFRPSVPQRQPSNWRSRITDSEEWMRAHQSLPFVQQLSNFKGPSLTVTNRVDNEDPPSDFRFISEYEFREATQRLDKEARTGCSCRPQNGRDIGCEYTYCECIEDAGDESEKLGFPYHAINEKQGCLRKMYLETRHMIYECNELCRCPPHCKNKVVQKGRQIPLDIFKTETRGWGLRCPEDIRQGQFVDVYLGEVITDEEARRRERVSSVQKNSYLFALDKFQMPKYAGDSDKDSLIAEEEEEDEDLPDPDLFLVDGQYCGGPTRFINHSCDPNLRIFAVSLYRGDSRVYELAFFAINDIEAMTELTFDYVDNDQSSSGNGKAQQGKVRCLCGAENCRGWLWI